MMGLRSRIESVMYGGPHEGPVWLSAGLAGMARLYGSVVRMRKIAYARKWINTHRLDCRVVSVGNITLGGTGKTPMTIYIARLIKSFGFSVAVEGDLVWNEEAGETGRIDRLQRSAAGPPRPSKLDT